MMNARPDLAKRRRPRRGEDGSPIRALARGLTVVAVLGVVGVIALRAYDGVPLRDYQTMYVAVPEVGNLRSHDQVRIAGVRVGQVIDLRISADGRARVELQLEPDAPALPADTKVAVRAAGLLGARYIELVPGHSERRLAEGSMIEGSADALAFGVPEALDTFDAETRGGVRDMVRELGTGTLGRGVQLNDAIRIASGAQRPFQALADSVLARPGSARRFFPSVDRMARTLAETRDESSRLFSPAATALQPFVDRRRAAQAMLDEAPPALRAARAGLSEGRRLLGATRALATAANATLPSAPSSLRNTTALLRSSRTPLRRTASLLGATERAVPAALRTTEALSPVLGPLKRVLDDLVPMARYAGRYGCDIVNFGSVFRSMTGLGANPGGEVGALGQFRLQVIPTPAESAGLENPEPVRIRDTYSPPCKYLGGTYPTTRAEGAGR